MRNICYVASGVMLPDIGGPYWNGGALVVTGDPLKLGKNSLLDITEEADILVWWMCFKDNTLEPINFSGDLVGDERADAVLFALHQDRRTRAAIWNTAAVWFRQHNEWGVNNG